MLQIEAKKEKKEKKKAKKKKKANIDRLFDVFCTGGPRGIQPGSASSRRRREERVQAILTTVKLASIDLSGWIPSKVIGKFFTLLVFPCKVQFRQQVIAVVTAETLEAAAAAVVEAAWPNLAKSID